MSCGVAEWKISTTLRWNVHILRVDDERLVKKIFEWSNGIQIRARPLMMLEKSGIVCNGAYGGEVCCGTNERIMHEQGVQEAW